MTGYGAKVPMKALRLDLCGGRHPRQPAMRPEPLQPRRCGYGDRHRNAPRRFHHVPARHQVAQHVNQRESHCPGNGGVPESDQPYRAAQERRRAGAQLFHRPAPPGLVAEPAVDFCVAGRAMAILEADGSMLGCHQCQVRTSWKARRVRVPSSEIRGARLPAIVYSAGAPQWWNLPVLFAAA